MKLRLTTREAMLAVRLRQALKEEMAARPGQVVTAQELVTALTSEKELGLSPEVAHRLVRWLMKEPLPRT